MAKTSIDQLAITIGANTNPLGADLRRAIGLLHKFQRESDRAMGPPARPPSLPDMRGVRASLAQFRAAGDAARMATLRAERFAARSRQAAAATELPFRAAAAGAREVGRIAADPLGSMRAGLSRTKAAVGSAFAAMKARAAEAGQAIRGRVGDAVTAAQASPVELPFKVAGGLLRGAGAAIASPLKLASRVLGRTAAPPPSADYGHPPAVPDRGPGMFSRVMAGARQATAGLGDFALKAAATGGALVGLELGLAGVAKSFGEVRGAVMAAGELEQQRVAFDVLVGDAKKAGRLIADIRQYGAETPFNNKELQGAGKQLLAYGVAADEVMSTLKRLGDVSAAFGQDLPIGELTYLYGTLFAQQRAYTKDLQQFAGRGIPIWDELSKVMGKPVYELKDLVEQGRVTDREIDAAFKSMTAEGGRFFKMTERQGKTFLGQWEQTVDAFDQAKTAFGQVLIDELGLKDAARDLAAFALRAKDGAGELRGMVRYAGDVGRAVAQTGWELAKAGTRIGGINADAMLAGFPALRQAAAEVKAIIQGAADFKLDEQQVVDAGFRLADALGRAMVGVGAVVQRVIDQFGDGLERARRAAEWIETHAPGGDRLANHGKDLNPTKAEFYDLRPPAGGIVDHLTGGGAGPLFRPHGGPPADPPAMAGYRRAMEAATMAAAELRHAVQRGRFEEAEALVPRKRAADAQLQRVYESFPGVEPHAAMTALREGRVPEGKPQLTGLAKEMEGFTAELRKAREAALEEVAARKRATEAANRAADAERQLQAVRAVASAAVPGLGGMTPWAGLVNQTGPPAVADYGREAAGMAAVGGAFPVLDQSRIDTRVPPHIAELLGQVKGQDPIPGLRQLQADLKDARKYARDVPDFDALADRFFHDKVKAAGAPFGLGEQDVRLPEASYQGSAEDAAIVANYRAERDGAEVGRADPTTLLQRLVDLMSQQVHLSKEGNRLSGNETPAASFPW